MIEYKGRQFKRVVCWFSCGAASATATVLALRKYGPENCVVVYQDTGSEHPDNVRFIKDFERATNTNVEIIKAEKYADIWEVFEKTRWLVGVGGARCTAELKRRVAEKYLDHFNDLEILGYTGDEKHRLDRWIESNEERFIDPVLIEHGYTKPMCFDELTRRGVKLPAMYLLGYQNNNCIGCVKGQAGYWNKIRRDFPDVFDRMALVERELNVAICKTEPVVGGKRQRIRVFLDELDPLAGRYRDEPPMTCGFLCGAA